MKFNKFSILFYLAIATIISPLSAQEQLSHLIFKSGDGHSRPDGYFMFNEKMYFVASSDQHGKEIWWTNGNSEVHLLKDLHPGPGNGIGDFNSLNQNAVIFNGYLYFVANDGNSKGELWRTDGSRTGTIKITNCIDYNVNRLTKVGDQIFFLSQHSDSLTVWKSDGTGTGTHKVKESLPFWNQPTYQASLGDQFIFTFQTWGTNNSRIWSSDGSTAGTHPITPELNGSGVRGTSDLGPYFNLDNELYFFVRSDTIFTEDKITGLMKTDGTSAGLTAVKELYDGRFQLLDYIDGITVGEKLYFSLFNANNRLVEIWITDGDSVGTQKIFEAQNDTYAPISNFWRNDNQLYFCGPDSVSGLSILSMDFSDHSITTLSNLNIDLPTNFLNIFSSIVTIRDAGEDQIVLTIPSRNNRKNYIYNFSIDSLYELSEMNRIYDLFYFNDHLYYRDLDFNTGYELWRNSISPGSSEIFANINTGVYGLNTETYLNVLDDKLYFNAGHFDTHLFQYTGDSIALLKGFNKGTTQKYSEDLILWKDELYFVSYVEESGFELWKVSSSSSSSPEMVHDIAMGPASSFPTLLTPHKDAFYFIVFMDNQYHLCKSNGQDFNIIKSMGTYGPNVPIRVLEILPFGEEVYFITDRPSKQLWKSDGTESGTVILKEFNECYSLTAGQDHLFFMAKEFYLNESVIWQSDGTMSGTVSILDEESNVDIHPKSLFSYKEELFFTMKTPEFGSEIWKWSPASEDLQLLLDINPGPACSVMDPGFTIFQNEIYFTANEGQHGFELWHSDGSRQNTRLLKDINDGVASSNPAEFTAVRDRLYFTAYTESSGLELWKSDGSELGTVQASDVMKGKESSSPSQIYLAGEDVFFIAETLNWGRQLWKVPYDSTSRAQSVRMLNTIGCYPNPAQDVLYLETNQKLTEGHIINQVGQQVLIYKDPFDEIDISHLPSGTYILIAKRGRQLLSAKFIKI